MTDFKRLKTLGHIGTICACLMAIIICWKIWRGLPLNALEATGMTLFVLSACLVLIREDML